MAERKKYVMLDYDKMTTPDGIILYRIKALKKFADIECNTLGGYIENTENLSQEGDCWLYGRECAVWGNAKVSGSAKLTGHSGVFGNAEVIAGTILNGEFIQDDAFIRGDRDHTCVLNVVAGDNITFYRDKDGKISMTSNDFHGKIAELPPWLTKNVSKEVKTIYLYALAYAIAKFNAYDMAEDFVQQFDSINYTLMTGDVNQTIKDVNSELYMRGDINGMIGQGPANNMADMYRVFNNVIPNPQNDNFGYKKEKY